MRIKADRRVIILTILFSMLILSALLTFLVEERILSGDILYYVSQIPNEVAWTSMVIFSLIALSTVGYFNEVYGRKRDVKKITLLVIITAAICISTTITSESVYPLLFNCGTIIIVLIGFMCGPIVSVPASIIVALVIHLYSLGSPSFENVCYIIQVLSAGIVPGLVSVKSYPDSRRGYMAIIALFLINITMIVIGSESLKSEEIFPKYIYAISALILFVLTCLSFYSLNVSKKMIDYRTESMRNKEDLRLAHEIQMTSVPQKFPISHSMDISAYMEPAIEVGGDFYDCIQISRNLTLFVVADVSDKGLPASLLMMRSMGSIRASAMTKSDPGVILTTFNKELCANNPADQFVSVWAGLYDSDTGKLCYANAGHPSPFIKRAGGTFERLPVRKAPIIGVVETARYKSDLTTMGSGDILFVFTDGVNEAFDKNDKELGYDGLQRILNSADISSAESIIASVKDGLKKHTGDIPMSDDITMLSFAVDRSWYHELTVPGKVGELDRVNEFIESVYIGSGCPRKDVLKMEIVSEEIFVNICDHAYVDREGDITVYCGYNDGEMKLTFADTAKSFNPINKEDIEIDEDVGKWPIGGFGIHMVKNLVTYMDYKYYAGMNIFTVWKKTSSCTEEPLQDPDSVQ